MSQAVNCEWRAAMPASLEAVEKFIGDFRRRSNALPNPANCFATELLAREALTNAVLHGCHTDPRKQIHCLVRLKGRRMLIVVGDGGDGFDWHAVRGRPEAPLEGCGRGIEIIHQYASHVRFNKKGNVVMIVKRWS